MPPGFEDHIRARPRGRHQGHKLFHSLTKLIRYRNSIFISFIKSSSSAESRKLNPEFLSWLNDEPG